MKTERGVARGWGQRDYYAKMVIAGEEEYFNGEQLLVKRENHISKMSRKAGGSNTTKTGNNAQ